MLRGLRAGRQSMSILPQILALVTLLSIGPFPHPVLLAPYRVLGCGETEGVGHFEDSCDWPPARWQHRAPATPGTLFSHPGRGRCGGMLRK